MGGGGSTSSSLQQPGTLSPVTGTLLDLFGAAPTIQGGQFVPTAGGTGMPGTSGGVFSAADFAPLTGLLENRPLNATERGLLGGGIQTQAVGAGQEAQDLLEQGAATLPALLETEPTALIASARRGFEQETVPSILERAPGFSSSDLQRELTRAGVDLETNVAGLREANLGRVAQTVAGIPAFAQALGGQLLDQATQVLGFGQFGRELARDASPAGDAFRVLSMIQALTGPAITTRGTSESKSANANIS